LHLVRVYFEREIAGLFFGFQRGVALDF
jgi:hypothetical protein